MREAIGNMESPEVLIVFFDNRRSIPSRHTSPKAIPLMMRDT